MQLALPLQLFDLELADRLILLQGARRRCAALILLHAQLQLVLLLLALQLIALEFACARVVRPRRRHQSYSKTAEAQ